jgi:hypothetical protein
MAKIFKNVIKEFDGYFKFIIFSIIEDHNSFKEHNPDGNLPPFSKVFNSEILKIGS